MKVLLLKDDKWQEYRKELLDHSQAYKFVAWMIEEVILVAPMEIDGHEFYHRNIVDRAIDNKTIDWKFGRPDVCGVIRVNFKEEDTDNRIVSWKSLFYGLTPEELRPQVREALELEDVVYKN